MLAGYCTGRVTPVIHGQLLSTLHAQAWLALHDMSLLWSNCVHPWRTAAGAQPAGRLPRGGRLPAGGVQEREPVLGPRQACASWLVFWWL